MKRYFRSRVTHRQTLVIYDDNTVHYHATTFGAYISQSDVFPTGDHLLVSYDPCLEYVPSWADLPDPRLRVSSGL